MWIGLFLVVAGILIILSNMDIIRGDAWNYIWPTFFILLGASMILKRLRKKEPNVFFNYKVHSDNNPKPPDEH
jgi:hypothetical protein